MGEIIPFPVWIIPFPVSKINFKPCGTNMKHFSKKTFLIRGIQEAAKVEIANCELVSE